MGITLVGHRILFYGTGNVHVPWLDICARQQVSALPSCVRAVQHGLSKWFRHFIRCCLWRSCCACVTFIIHARVRSRKCGCSLLASSASVRACLFVFAVNLIPHPVKPSRTKASRDHPFCVDGPSVTWHATCRRRAAASRRFLNARAPG